MAKLVGISENGVKYHLKKLKREGKITHIGPNTGNPLSYAAGKTIYLQSIPFYFLPRLDDVIVHLTSKQ